jgi:hypothetical protein
MPAGARSLPRRALPAAKSVNGDVLTGISSIIGRNALACAGDAAPLTASNSAASGGGTRRCQPAGSTTASIGISPSRFQARK